MASAQPESAELIEPLAANATGPVARIARPLGSPPSNFRSLMQRTLALRPRD
jgi:hypothetical protein